MEVLGLKVRGMIRKKLVFDLTGTGKRFIKHLQPNLLSIASKVLVALVFEIHDFPSHQFLTELT